MQSKKRRKALKRSTGKVPKFCEEEKEKKGQHQQDRNKNPFEEEKQKKR